MSDNPRLRINQFRSTDAERYLWEDAAKRAGYKDLSAFLRDAANEKVERVRTEGKGPK